MTPVVAPPFVVQQRAWECAMVLRDERWDALPIGQRVGVEVVFRMAPDRLGWAECHQMFQLYRETFDVRV